MILARMRTIPLLAVCAACAVLAACGSPAPTAAPSSAAPTPAPAASPTYDRATLLACRQAAKATEATGSDAEELGRDARGHASNSDVDALREKAEKYGDAPLKSQADNANAIAAAYDIGAWCITHGVT